MHDTGIATIKRGALSISLSKWLSKANAQDATEIVIARCMIECFTLKQRSLRNHRDEKIKSGIKHSITFTSSGDTTKHSLLNNSQSCLVSIFSMYFMRLQAVTSRHTKQIKACSRCPRDSLCQTRQPLSSKSTASEKMVRITMTISADSRTMRGTIDAE